MTVITLFRDLAAYAKPHWRLMCLDLACATVVAVLDLMFPILSRVFLDDLIPHGRITEMLRLTALIVALYLVRTLSNFVMSYWGHLVGSRIEYDMRRDLFEHLQTLSFKFYDDNKVGQIMSRLVGDLREIGELMHHGPEDLFLSTVMIGGSFFILVRIDAGLTALIFGLLAVLVAFTLTVRRNMMSAFRRIRSTHAEINEGLESSISGVRLAQAFANEEYEIRKFRTRNRRYRESWKRGYKILGVFSAGSNLLTDLMGVAVISAGGYMVYAGQLSFGELVAFLLYTTFFVKPVRRLVDFTQQFQSGIAGFRRFMEMKGVEPEVVDAPEAIDIHAHREAIRFEGVWFRYAEGLPWVLRDFNLEIPRGRTVALVGPSGVGKTTLIHLIPRFYDVTRGRVTIDGRDVRAATLKSLRQLVGNVPQDVFIFHGTIGENIEYGHPGATPAEVEAAAQDAGIHEFIAGLPDGYDALVGERGVKLSGGQRQRVALARVFLRNPPVLILDEATSSLDTETELAVQGAIERLARDRTTIVVAHRLSTIKNADEILVLTDAGIQERGTHDELLAREHGLYARLYRAQFRGYIPDDVGARLPSAPGEG